MANILVVEDERLVAMDVQNILTRIGYVVPEIASSGEEAIQKAESSRPDLVLMDIMLKGAIDGVEAAGVMQRRLDIPVVYLTAFGDQDTVRRARDTSPFGYILKPFTEGDLRSAIEIALHKHEFEAKLKERERWVSTTLASIADAVLTTDPEQRVTYMNQVAEQLTGWRAHEAVGERMSLVFRTLERRASGVGDQALRTTVIIRRTGEQIAVEESVSPIIDERRHVLGSVIVFRDVTQKRRLQAKLAVHDRLVALGAMASGVAHEMNNPLTYVMANLDFAGRELATVGEEVQDLREADASLVGRLDELRQAVREAHEGADRVRRIVRDLKTFSNPDDKTRKAVDLRSSVELAARMCAPDLEHRARLDLALDPAPLVDANEALLGQVVVHLLMNAIQALPEGGSAAHRIRIATGSDEAGRAILEVADSGSGIPPDVLPQIFDPFFTTRTIGAGMGLGLTICHRVVTDLGGDITVESAVGKGTTFRVVLPAGRTSGATRVPSP